MHDRHNYHNIKTGGWFWDSGPASPPGDGRPAADKAVDYHNSGGKTVNIKDLNNSNSWLNLLGDAALIGTGAGLTWTAAKKLVETAYRNKLEDAIRKKRTATQQYDAQNIPIDASFVPEQKQASASREISDRELSKGRISTDVGRDALRHESVVLSPKQDIRTSIAATMATTPVVWNSLAMAAIPAVAGLTFWKGRELAKTINKGLATEEVDPLEKEERRARRRFENAAKTLRRYAAE